MKKRTICNKCGADDPCSPYIIKGLLWDVHYVHCGKCKNEYRVNYDTMEMLK